jgi:hypothetical protein
MFNSGDKSTVYILHVVPSHADVALCMVDIVDS